MSSQAQTFSIDWSMIAGGGGMSTGGVYAVSGTLSQPSAGRLAGGSYVLEDGFWSIVLVQTPGAPTLHLAKAAPGFATLWWTPATPGFVLQFKDAFTSSSWTNAPRGATNSVTVPTTGPHRFYRLIKP